MKKLSIKENKFIPIIEVDGGYAQCHCGLEVYPYQIKCKCGQSIDWSWMKGRIK